MGRAARHFARSARCVASTAHSNSLEYGEREQTLEEIVLGCAAIVPPFDPFDTTRLAFLGQDCVLFVDDFSLSKVPVSNGKKFYISSPTSQTTISHSTSSEKLSDKKSSKSTIRRMSGILVGESSRKASEEDSSGASECLQLAYHKACRHHLILLYSRENTCPRSRYQPDREHNFHGTHWISVSCK